MIQPSVAHLIGGTPLVRLNKLPQAGSAEIVVKLEAYNPGGSVKDRIALAMIEDAEQTGALTPGDTIVEPTSGNTGIALAVVAAAKGYRLIITMPDDSSEERRSLLEHFGAEVVLTPARKLMRGAIERARGIVEDNPRCFMPSQFDNPANPMAHERTTAVEIIDGVGELDAFVAGVGTGGTVTGVGRALRRHNPKLLIIGVEPSRAPALSGTCKPEPHAIQGIGAGFVPKTLDRSMLDRVVACDDRDAFDTAVQLARREGISAGISGGAAVWAALQLAAELGIGNRVVTVIPDGWDRYLSMPTPQPLGGLDFII